MTIKEFEDAVWQLEGIRLVVREPTTLEVEDYDFQNAASRNASIAEWLRSRVFPRLGGGDVVVVDGRGELPNRRTRLDTLRFSYDEA